MTNEEAKIYLRNWRNAIESRGDTDFSDAMQSLSIAISALENIDRITAERDALVKELISYKRCDKCCVNCKYNAISLADYPCSYCDDSYSNWEWRERNTE